MNPQLLQVPDPQTGTSNLPRCASPQPSLALVGAGYWGKNLARNFRALGALHTICDADDATLASYDGEYTGVKKVTDFDAVLGETSIAKVAIAAPAALHYDLAKAALNAGKDVFVEKPPQSCAHRRTPRTDGQEGLRVLQVLQAAQASLEKDGEAVSPLLLGRGEGKGEESHRPPSSSLRTPHSAFRTPPAAPGARPGGQSPSYFVHPTAVVDEGAEIGKGTKIWHFSHIMRGAKIGERCVFGQNVNVDGGTIIGNNVKVQNNVSIYTGLVIEDDVFLGPSCVLTNVSNPRSQVNRHSLYEKTLIKRGATIGANSTILCGLTIGRYAFIAAGTVVTKDVPDYALIMGNPGRQKGWMSRHGHRLKPGADGSMVCPESGFRYRLCSEPSTSNHQPPAALRCLDLGEDEPLPKRLAKSEKIYDEFKMRTSAVR